MSIWTIERGYAINSARISKEKRRKADKQNEQKIKNRKIRKWKSREAEKDKDKKEM